MRTIRRITQLFLTLLGGALVIWAVYRTDVLYDRVLVSALGLLIMELGIWQVTHTLMPNQREFKPLREETHFFLKTVRRLNSAALQAHGGSQSAILELDRLQEELHHSVDRMRTLAGRTEAELGFADAATYVEVPRKKRGSVFPLAWARRRI